MNICNDFLCLNIYCFTNFFHHLTHISYGIFAFCCYISHWLLLKKGYQHETDEWDGVVCVPKKANKQQQSQNKSYQEHCK